MDATKILHDLWNVLHVPESLRDESWHEEVARRALDAPMEAVDGDTLIQGPDALRYQRVAFPRQERFQGVTLRTSLHPLLDKICGYAIVKLDGDPLYVFSHGDLLSLDLYGRLLVKWDAPWDEPAEGGIVTEPRTVMVGVPSEQMLPDQVRRSIRELLIAGLKIAHPKVLLTAEHGKASNLVFNVFREDHDSETQFRWAMSSVAAFLPRHLRLRLIFVGRDTIDEKLWTEL